MGRSYIMAIPRELPWWPSLWDDLDNLSDGKGEVSSWQFHLCRQATDGLTGFDGVGGSCRRKRSSPVCCTGLSKTRYGQADCVFNETNHLHAWAWFDYLFSCTTCCWCNTPAPGTLVLRSFYNFISQRAAWGVKRSIWVRPVGLYD